MLVSELFLEAFLIQTVVYHSHIQLRRERLLLVLGLFDLVTQCLECDIDCLLSETGVLASFLLGVFFLGLHTH